LRPGRMDASGTTQPSLEAWQGVPDTDAAGWSGKGRKGRSCECVCPGRYGPLPPQASPRRGAACRAADAAPDATRQYDGAFEGPALLAQGALGSVWCRPATRRPHRRRPGPKSLGRTARDLISVSLAPEGSAARARRALQPGVWRLGPRASFDRHPQPPHPAHQPELARAHPHPRTVELVEQDVGHVLA
jgi:hypothetical protein